MRQLPYRLIESTATHLSLVADVAVDVNAASRATRRANAGESGIAHEELDCIVTAGDLLPDWYDEWLVFRREQFRQARLHALESLCQALAEAGRHGKAIEVGLAAVAGEPLRESAHRAVMRVHLAEGNRHEALRQYQLCRRALAPLGLNPSPETEALRGRCASRDGSVPAAG